MQITESKRIHFVGVGGVGMGTFAVALSEAGFNISGSDTALYEPMKSVLTNAKVKLIEGYDPKTLDDVSPDLVVIGNVIRKDNPEAQAWIRSGKRFISFPEAVRTLLIQEKKSIVVAGTHGKTTTTTWISYLLQRLGLSPSYFIGGVPKDLDRGCRLNPGDLFVGEGDEYDSAFFDKGPKFLHYNPNVLVLTSIEFDHADIYKDLAHVQASFEKLIALLPGDGLCVARYDDPVVMAVVGGALCPVQTFGTGQAAMWRLARVEESTDGLSFEIVYKGRSIGTFKTPLLGEHNCLNLMSGIICAVNLGISMDKVRPILETFGGVKRRQEVLLKSPITLVDDFAHHPTEVSATLKGVRRRYTSGKLIAIFEPRSATARRNVHQNEYSKAFESADEIWISIPYKSKDLKDEERFSSEALVEELVKGGKKAKAFSSVDEVIDQLVRLHSAGDVVVVMSNGEFGKIQEKILKAFS
jgi:UDP-N-acetylmuramate: L-alanyl-gamma-D-glutamyl-meso-diaminopimelate ligase